MGVLTGQVKVVYLTMLYGAGRDSSRRYYRQSLPNANCRFSIGSLRYVLIGNR